MTLSLALAVGALYACGTWMLLQRSLSRTIIGLALLAHGANLLLLLAGGGGGAAPIIGDEPADYADPLPQALALTAIVITFGVSAFLLALAERSRQLTGDDLLGDEPDDDDRTGMRP